MSISVRRTSFTSAKFCAGVLLLVSGGAAQATLTTIPDSALNSSPGVYTAGGYYTDVLGPNIVTTGGGNAANVGQLDGRNDDGYMALNLGFNFTFYGTTYNSLFINNNGNVTFGSGLAAYVPTGPTGANVPIISTFFADVDTRNISSGVVHYNLTSDQLVVTWDNVGYFSELYPPGDSFQLVLRADSYLIPTGEGQIGFFYEDMGWETSQTNTVAAVGFGDGSGNGETLDGSLVSGLNSIVQNQYLWFDPNLAPITAAPEPDMFPMLIIGLFGVGFVALRKRIAPEC